MICESLSNYRGERFNILAIGLTSNSLILITKNFEVYQLEKKSLERTISNLYLNSKPISMESKFPVLYNHPSFQKIMHKIYNAFILMDEYSDWLVFNTLNTNAGIKYDIVAAKVYAGYARKRRNNNSETLISTDPSGATIRTSRLILAISSPRSICLAENDSRIQIVKENIECRKPVDWPVLTGFVERKKFRLFGKDYVYVFDEKAFDNANQSFVLQRKSYDKFFICPTSVLPRSNISTSKWIVLLILILSVLLSLLLILLFLVRIKQRIHKKHCDNKLLVHCKTNRSAFDIEGRKLIGKLSSVNVQSQL
ncbi:hypothetical protein SSS_06285 [Sarcoptes scabiei]|uniref:Uncharacterized protein n=1 Tax=Sarcoptes scabiei TaxID=52283 RepID=A0A834RI04_SARSC|nr:hypothetical protein SSS_06285 [Sarcoptes scabiei]